MLMCQITTHIHTHTESNDRERPTVCSIHTYTLCSHFHMLQVIRLFNLFITYGDTFLPSPTTYDELYYELIRLRHLFDSLYQLGTKHIISLLPSQYL